MFTKLNNKYKKFNASFNATRMKIFMEHIYDVEEVGEVLQGYMNVIFRNYFTEISNTVKNHCQWIEPRIFDRWSPVLVFITNTNKFDGFCICLTNGKNSIDVAEIYSSRDIIVNDVVYFDLCDFSTEYVEVYGEAISESTKKIYESYLDIVARELYKVETACGLYFKEINYLTGDCDISRFRYILRQIDGYGKYELIQGDILPYNSGFDSSNLDQLIDLTGDVKDNCKISKSIYTEVDMLGCTLIFVDVLVSWGDYDKIYIHFYDGNNAVCKNRNHAILIKSSVHVEHIAVFIPEHRVYSVIGNTGHITSKGQSVGVFIAQSNHGVKIDLSAL